MVFLEKNNEFNPYEFDGNINDPFLNPMIQYEQAYMYYRYLTQTIEYKIKCKEYEKMCKNDSRAERRIE